MLPKLQSLKLSACRGFWLGAPTSSPAPLRSGVHAPLTTPPRLPSQRRPLPIPSWARAMPPSCLRDGDRPLTAFETSSVVLPTAPEPPLSARSPATGCRDLGPQPLRPQPGRLGRGSDRDRMGTVMGSDLEGSDENKSRNTARAETRQGRNSGSSPLPTPAAPQPAASRLGLARCLWGSGGAPRDPPDPQKLGTLGDGPRLGSWPPRSPRLSEQRPRHLLPSPTGCAACAPGERRALLRGSGQRAAGRGARERRALGSWRRTPGSARPAAIYAKRVPPRTQTAERPAAPGLECWCVLVWWRGGRGGVCFISLKQKKA